MRALLLITSCLLSLPALAAAQVKLGEPPEDRAKARQEAVERAKQELAARLGASMTTLKLVRAVEAKWPDASLGCPEKDRMYAQVVSRGWKVVLEKADGSRHEVHVAGKRAVVCPRPDKQ